MDIQENDFEQNIFCKENSYFSSETFINTVNDALKSEEENNYKDSLRDLFTEINLSFVNSNITNSFTNFLKKIEKENDSEIPYQKNRASANVIPNVNVNVNSSVDIRNKNNNNIICIDWYIYFYK